MRASAETGRPNTLFLVVAAAILAVDQVTKAVAAARLQAGSPVPVLGDWLRLTLTRNTGSAFGLISSGWVLIAAGAFVCALIVTYVSRGRLRGARGRALPLALTPLGALC